MQCLLSAMYNRVYKFENLADLEDLVRLADFYCALPVVSASLYMALMHIKSRFAEDISLYPLDFLKLAKKLRQPILFRDALVYAVAGWPSLASEDMPKDIRDIIIKAEHGILDQIMRTHLLLSRAATKDHEIHKLMLNAAVEHFWTHEGPEDEDYIEDTDYVFEGTRQGSFPASYYRYVAEKLRSKPDSSDWSVLQFRLDDLIERKLVLVKKNNSCSSVENTGFFCASIKDEDLPWPKDEIDW